MKVCKVCPYKEICDCAKDEAVQGYVEKTMIREELEKHCPLYENFIMYFHKKAQEVVKEINMLYAFKRRGWVTDISFVEKGEESDE
ncbi:MAG: hypothetical protein ACTSUO_00760 [Candidatus Thorarchaeota archaeon]